MPWRRDAVTTPWRPQLVTARRTISVHVTALIVHLIAVVWLEDDLSALGSVLAVFAIGGTVFLL